VPRNDSRASQRAEAKDKRRDSITLIRCRTVSRASSVGRPELISVSSASSLTEIHLGNFDIQDTTQTTTAETLVVSNAKKDFLEKNSPTEPLSGPLQPSLEGRALKHDNVSPSKSQSDSQMPFVQISEDCSKSILLSPEMTVTSRTTATHPEHSAWMTSVDTSDTHSTPESMTLRAKKKPIFLGRRKNSRDNSRLKYLPCEEQQKPFKLSACPTSLADKALSTSPLHSVDVSTSVERTIQPSDNNLMNQSLEAAIEDGSQWKIVTRHGRRKSTLSNLTLYTGANSQARLNYVEVSFIAILFGSKKLLIFIE